MKGKSILSALGLAGVMVASLVILLTVAAAGPNVPPVLIDQSPAANAFDVPLDAAVSATYDQDMDPATVDEGSFAVHAMFTGWLTEAFSVQSGTIMLDPAADFHPGELVQVSATTETLSLMGGEGPISPTVWQFYAEAPAGDGHFTDSGQRLGGDDNRGLALGDLDGDGDIDAVAANFIGPNRVYLNDGEGHFTLHQSVGAGTTFGVPLGDLDGDGDLDMFESKGDGGCLVWWNDGSGTFTYSGQMLNAPHAFFTDLGDLDGDGDLDAFVPNYGTAPAPSTVWFNDGQGFFSDSGQALGIHPAVSVALGDVDADGDLDAYLANGGFTFQPNTVWINDGSGYFTDSGQLLGNRGSADVALGDFDDDDDLDAFVTNLAGVPAQAEVWVNVDGNGTFTRGQSLPSGVTYGLGLGDVDADGDLDAVAGGPNMTTVWLNDGTGSFAFSGQMLPTGVIIGLADLNDDLSLDVFVANGQDYTGPNLVWFNGWYPLHLPLIYGP